MRKIIGQMSLFDTYNDVRCAMENDKPEFLRLLEAHIKLKEIIPAEFYWAFYRKFGRPRDYAPPSFVRFYILQNLFAPIQDSTLLIILRISRELREFCGFETVPDASKITRFRQDFVRYIKLTFDRLVEITEPICRELDAKKADYLMYPFVKQQYINGHFCYAHKAGILANGLGIVRDISFFDDDFRRRHPEVVSKKTDNPDLDKEIGDSTSLRPALSDFFETHPSFSYGTFIGDSSFDSYDNYTMLRDEFHFERMAIPLNPRNSSSSHDDFNEKGVPLCPLDKTPFTFLGVSGGKNRSKRFKWVCHKSEKIPKSSKRICSCETPCTDSSYGRCVYTYPDKELRLYPGIARGTEHRDNLYRHRVLIERTINILKDSLGAAHRKSFSPRTAKADLLFAGITQLVGVILAHAINKPHLYRRCPKTKVCKNQEEIFRQI